MATTPSLTAQAAQAQRENAVAIKTLAAAQNTVIAAQKAGRTPSPAALAAVEAATTAVKATQLATNNATAAVTSASGKTPPATGLGVPDSVASAGNRNGGVSPLVDPGAKQLPYNVSTPAPSSGSLLSNSSGLLNTLGAAALGAAAANPLAALSLASSIGSIFKSTKDVLPASTAVPKSAAELNPASDPSQFPAYDDDGNLQPGFAINEETGGTYFRGDAPGKTADAVENVFDPGNTFNAGEESVFDPNNVDPNSDPFEQARFEAGLELDGEPREFDPGDVAFLTDEEADALDAQQAENRRVLSTEAIEVDPTVDPGENVFDPGETINAGEESVFDPANVEPNSDPFEQARFEAEQALAEQEATEFEPTDVPVMTDEEADALELEQAENRRILATEAIEVEPTVDPNAENIFDPTGTAGVTENVFNPEAVGADDPVTIQPSGDFAANPEEEEERTNLNAAIKQGTLDKARAQNTIANQRRNPNNGDWRVKLRLAPGADYLYNAPEPGILQPLKGTGIIFPYTPTIGTSYKANYASYDLTHSNYKGYYYQSSSVEPVTLSCPFTAQSTTEAEYLLAVIHFFKSVTKMFYGQDPQRGTPPPLVYLTGLGEYQFNEHPCVVQSFTYDLPVDVDYIRARSPNVNNSNMLNKRQSTNPTGPGTTWGGGILGNVLGGAINRLANAGLPKGGMSKPPAPASFGQNSPTYVPTKMNISISLLPVQSRKQQSQQFSLRQYANGDLLKGGFW